MCVYLITVYVSGFHAIKMYKLLSEQSPSDVYERYTISFCSRFVHLSHLILNSFLFFFPVRFLVIFSHLLPSFRLHTHTLLFILSFTDACIYFCIYCLYSLLFSLSVTLRQVSVSHICTQQNNLLDCIERPSKASSKHSFIHSFFCSFAHMHTYAYTHILFVCTCFIK